jgi:hypothetical protein
MIVELLINELSCSVFFPLVTIKKAHIFTVGHNPEPVFGLGIMRAALVNNN